LKTELTEKLAELSVELGEDITPAKSEAALKKQISEAELNLEKRKPVLEKVEELKKNEFDLNAKGEIKNVDLQLNNDKYNPESVASDKLIAPGLTEEDFITNNEKTLVSPLKQLRFIVSANATFSTKHNDITYKLAKGEREYLPEPLAFELESIGKVTILE